LAFQEAEVREGKRSVLNMKTVNGRPTRRTPTLRDEIRFVEPTPTWTVPFSIAVKDKLDLLKRDPKLLLNQQIWVYDLNRNVLDPFQIDWDQINRTNFRYVLIQQPGPHNALGLIKFPLTNPWFIYMHDTNEPHLMKESYRLRSSGCVRMEKPWELASYLLSDQPEWTQSKLLQKRYSTQQIFLKQRLPVYFLYLTVQLEPTGEIRFAEDFYGQDRRLIELFDTRGSLEKF
ncbi:MAG: L,D-transpeptidase family protein, partial [Bdellovibrionales bacterium]